MNLDKMSSLLSRALFVVAMLLLFLAVVEKIVNAAGYTIMQSYEPSRLLELAATMMVFVIALVLRQIREGVLGRGGG